MKKLYFVLIPIYVYLVLWFTVFGRGVTLEAGQLELFWSYRRWFAGDMQLGLQILGNIAFFVPLGYMLADVCRKRWSAVVAACMLSCVVEVSQLVTMRGLFELDDIIDNTLGGLIGLGLWQLVGGKKVGIVGAALSVLSFCWIVFSYRTPVDSTPCACCFQVNEDLGGFFLMYEHNTPEEYEVYLQSTEGGEKRQLEAEYGLYCPDVDEYFACEYDYTSCGFQLHDLPEEGEYEFIIKYTPFVSISTGVYVCDGRICYTRQEGFSAPNLDEDFIKKGRLRVYRPDHHCWVYQYEGALYWIADEMFFFSPTGATLIQYQLWTTQIARLPQQRLANEWYWDNIGGTFEDYEIKGDFGDYRVMKRKLPTEYAITAIVTGYHANGHWIWQNYFRPIYEFEL